MRRLYLRIHLAVLASLIVFAVLAAIAWRLASDDGRDGREQTAALAGELVAELLPADQSVELLTERLRRWEVRAGVDLTLFSADGGLIAAAGMPIERPSGSRTGWRFGHGGPPAYLAPLPDGRQLVLRKQPAGAGGGGRRAPPFVPGFLASLVLIAIAVGIGAYPVVRRLTRRLEHLQRSVDALGAGDLSSRVEERGSDEVAGLAKSFNRSAARIESLVRAQQSLLANASHELRSPLARLRMALALLPDDALRPVQTELQRDIAELDQLIDEILLASRLDAMGIPPPGGWPAGATPVPGGLQREALDLAALVAEECARTGAEFSLAAADGVPLTGDPRLLRRLVRNLLENAQRYGAGLAVEVELARTTEAIMLTVSDRGPGVPAEDRDRIFEPFHRARGASEHQGGVGLGLALARSIALHHGATLRVAPREGGGSRFIVKWPSTIGNESA